MFSSAFIKEQFRAIGYDFLGGGNQAPTHAHCIGGLL
jgi:hypothetical protein